MTPITTLEERDRAAARADRLANLMLHVGALLKIVDHPNGDPLLCDAGRYVGAILEEFGCDLDTEVVTLSRAIRAWDSRENPP